MTTKIKKFKSTSEGTGVAMKLVQAKVTDVLRLIHVNMSNDTLPRCCTVKQPVVIPGVFKGVAGMEICTQVI